MKICHSQPHLVPPMKLVFYDSLPSPGPQSRSRASSLLPTLIGEGRNLAAKASSRASLLVRRKAPKRPTISAPSNFRRVEPPHSRVGLGSGSFRPLELSIYMPGNQLPELPAFDKFSLDGLRHPSPPPKAVTTSQFDMYRARHCQSATFQLPRKPVGSGSRRSCLATLEQMTERERRAPPNPLIPHFSTLVTSPPASVTRMRPLSAPLDRVQEPISPSSPSLSPARDKPLPSTPVTPTASPSSDRPSLDHFRASKRRFVSTSPSTIQEHSPLNSNPPERASPKPPPPPPITTTALQHSRSRTMSGSTLSSTTTAVTAGHGTSPSLSSAVTAATTTLQFSMDKEIESGLQIPLSPKYIDSFPLVYEEEEQGQGQQQQRQGHHPRGYEYDRLFPDTPIGVAF